MTGSPACRMLVPAGVLVDSLALPGRSPLTGVLAVGVDDGVEVRLER